MALTVTRLIGVYDADGSLVGELRYALRKVSGRGHCSLCELTHRGVRRRRAWDQLCERLQTPVDLVHRDERDEAILAATGSTVPTVVAEAGDQLVVLLGPTELDACGTDVTEFERRLRDAAAAHGLDVA